MERVTFSCQKEKSTCIYKCIGNKLKRFVCLLLKTVEHYLHYNLFTENVPKRLDNSGPCLDIW